MSKGSKQQFMGSLLKGSNWDLVNGVGLRTLSNDRVAKLSLSTHGTADTYEKLTLKIINKNDGVVDSTQFLFKDHLTPDKNNTHPSAQFKKCEVKSYVQWDWYIDRPTKESVQSMLKSVEDYLNYLV